MSQSVIKNLLEVIVPGEPTSTPEWSRWKIQVIQNEDCQSYVVTHLETLEGIIVDPKLEDMPAYLDAVRSSPGITWIAIIDTHTHADHVSAAAPLSAELGAPVVMQAQAPTLRAHLRVSQDTRIVTRAGPLRLIVTPGHTPDSLSALWGPFAFTGDAILFGDVGRDDLPGGNPIAHYETLVKLREILTPETLILPGHDPKGGRVSTWAYQLKNNTSLTQSREDFIREARDYDGATPRLLKKSLTENFK